MSGIVRIGDTGIGICYSHKVPQSVTAVVISGNPNITVDGQQVATIGSVVLCSCGHSSMMITGDPNITADGISVCTLGNTFGPNPSGIITTSSETTVAQ